MRLGRLGSPELIALAGALLLAVGLFLPWYETDPANRNAVVAGTRGSVSAWLAERRLFVAVAVAPFVLARIMLREHQLSWPRGELTAVLAMAGLVVVLYVGVIARPGQPAGAISLGAGWYLALLGCILECAGGAVRAGSTERPRKPPGVL